MAMIILGWLKDLGPLLLAVAVAWATWRFQKWQVRLAKQKLRHDLYDRRLAIYVAFEELLVALPEKRDEEIKAALRKAQIASRQGPFLLGDPTIQAYLEGLCKQITDDVIGNIMFLDAMRQQGAMSDPKVGPDIARRANALGQAKLTIPDLHLGELSEQFREFLKLTDFWK